MCNLQQITMKYYDDSSTNKKTDASLDVGVAAVSGSVQNTKSETVGNEITIKFGNFGKNPGYFCFLAKRYGAIRACRQREMQTVLLLIKVQ